MSKTFFFGHTKIVQAKRTTKYFFIFLQRTNKYNFQVVHNKRKKPLINYRPSHPSLPNDLSYRSHPNHPSQLKASVSVLYTTAAQASPSR